MESEHTSDWPVEADLISVGISDAQGALRVLRDLAGSGVTDDDLRPMLPLLLHSLRSSPDADRALNSFGRWFAAVGSPASHLRTLVNHPVAVELFCVITGCSQYFADLLVRHPEYFEIIANRGVRGGTKSADLYQREAQSLVDACIRPELKRDALRRWKAREMLRIGVRDLAGLADMPETAAEFSWLADACVRQALQIAIAAAPGPRDGTAAFSKEPLKAAGPADTEHDLAGAGAPAPSTGSADPLGSHPTFPARNPRPPDLEAPFSVIAMGKLGGIELNYSSDIDLMFVTADDLPAELVLENGRTVETNSWLTRLGENLIKVLNEETADGHVFRVDMRLRPEGRFGPLVRSLSSYQAYYESWAESWERQALIKARPIAGSLAVGVAYAEMVSHFVYRPLVSAELVDEVRANKRKMEQKCALEHESETNVKTGFGGIRDIEFTVQLLQLELGGRIPSVRTSNTLEAIGRLREAAALTPEEARQLSDDYRFLRNLEHRLQLLHQFHTQTMPAKDDPERAFLAYRMGFPNLQDFEADLDARRRRVHGHLDSLFYSRSSASSGQTPEPLSDWSDLGALLDSLQSPEAVERLTSRLKAAGFVDIPAALHALRLPMSGNEFGGMPPDTPEEFKRVAPRLLAAAAASPDPDSALAGLEALALAVPNRAQLYASLDDSPELIDRIVGLASAAPPLVLRLTQRLEWMEGLFAEEQQDSAADTMGSWNALSERLSGVEGKERGLEAIARYYLRQTLFIGARECWGWSSAMETASALTALAESVLMGLIEVCGEALAAAETDPAIARDAFRRVAAVGLGKLGGGELGYGSDWDLVFAYDDRDRDIPSRAAERTVLVHKLVESVNNAIRTLATYGAAIEMDMRLRPWGKKGAIVLTPEGFSDYFKTSADMWERQAALKARFVAGSRSVGRRLERVMRRASTGRAATPEELSAVRAMKRRIETERLRPGAEFSDLKLGHGGLTDIEWLSQYLQLKHAGTAGPSRSPNTVKALEELKAAGVIESAAADQLADTYLLLTTVRNGLWLYSGRSTDTIGERRVMRVLARRLGYVDGEELPAEDRLLAELRERMQAARSIFEERFDERRAL